MDRKWTQKKQAKGDAEMQRRDAMKAGQRQDRGKVVY
jgi:hypothetical protein